MDYFASHAAPAALKKAAWTPPAPLFPDRAPGQRACAGLRRARRGLEPWRHRIFLPPGALRVP